MNARHSELPAGLQAPSALAWAVVFDILLMGVVILAAFGATMVAESTEALLAIEVPLGLLMVGVLTIVASLRRGCSWVWVAQLVLLCLVVGVAAFPGLVFVPLLVAWCSPNVRDWFDPPLHREFR